MRSVGLAAAGGLLGLASKLGDQWVSGAFALVFSGPAPYAAAMIAIGWFARRPLSAAFDSAAFFVALCLTYYAAAAWVFRFPVGNDSYFWVGLALTGCPLGSAVIRAARDSRWVWILLGMVAVFALGVGAGRLYAIAQAQSPLSNSDQALAGAAEVALGLLVVALAKRPWRVGGAMLVAVIAAVAMAAFRMAWWTPLLWFLELTRGH